MKRSIYYGGFIIIWLWLLTQIGINIFSVVLGIVGSLFWLFIWASVISGINKAKGEMYLANKYDEDNNK